MKGTGQARFFGAAPALFKKTLSSIVISSNLPFALPSLKLCLDSHRKRGAIERVACRRESVASRLRRAAHRTGWRLHGWLRSRGSLDAPSRFGLRSAIHSLRRPECAETDLRN